MGGRKGKKKCDSTNDKRRVKTDRQRIEKFLERVAELLESPIWTDRDQGSPMATLVVGLTGAVTGQIHAPAADRWTLIATAALIRPLLLCTEDTYVPDVAKSLASLTTSTDWAESIELFKQDAEQFVRWNSDSQQSAFSVRAMTKGDASSDTGWQTTDEVARNFIYGWVVHRDEDKRQVITTLHNVQIRQAVVHYLVERLTWLNMARNLIRDMITAGVVDATDPYPDADQVAEADTLPPDEAEATAPAG